MQPKFFTKKIKLACLGLAILGATGLSGCAQMPWHTPANSCLDVPCVPCIFPFPAKPLSQHNEVAQREGTEGTRP